MGRGFDAWLSMWAPPPYAETVAPDGVRQVRLTSAPPDSARIALALGALPTQRPVSE
jgi:hypothetical protein